jgi:YolD-like protein
MNELVLEAMEYNLPLTLVVYQNKRLITISGYIHYIDPQQMEFRIKSLDDELKIVHYSKVKAIHKCEEAMDKF